MKKFKITSLCFLVIIGLASCKQKTAMEQAIATETSNLVNVDSLNKIRNVHSEADTQSILGEPKATVIDSARIAYMRFVEIGRTEKYEDALHFYRENKSHFFVYFETTTELYEFHEEIIFPLMRGYLPEKQASNEMIEIFELLQFMTEAVIKLGKSQHGYVPSHYGRMMNELARAYMDAEMWDKALEQANKVKVFMEVTFGKENYGYATGLCNEAIIYMRKGDRPKALSVIYQAKAYYEKAIASGQDEDFDILSKALQKVIDIISEWEN